MESLDVLTQRAVNENNCAGCGQPLLLKNAWMIDGCPCNAPAGVNDLNLRRWTLLEESHGQFRRALDGMVNAFIRCHPSGKPIDCKVFPEYLAAIKAQCLGP